VDADSMDPSLTLAFSTTRLCGGKGVARSGAESRHGHWRKPNALARSKLMQAIADLL